MRQNEGVVFTCYSLYSSAVRRMQFLCVCHNMLLNLIFVI